MKQLVKLLLNVSLFIILALPINAQMGKVDGSKYGQGDDSVRCVTNLSLYRGEIKNKDYHRAWLYWKPAFDECPGSSKNLYIDGVKIYREFIEKETDPKRLNDLTDTLMLIYDRRIVYFGEKGTVRGRQGTDLLRYRRNDGVEYVKQGYDYLKESIILKEEDVSTAVLPTLLSAALTLYNNNLIDEKTVIEDYVIITQAVDFMVEESPDNDRLKELKSSLDNNFFNEGPAQCENFINYFTEEHKTKKEDINFLTMLTRVLLAHDCAYSELFFTAAKDLHRLAPSAKSAMNIAALAMNKGEYSDAAKYFKQAIELENDENAKAEYYNGLANAYYKLDDFPSARTAALKAVSLKDDYGDPYILIGQLYADSKNMCTDDSDNKNLPNAVYWLAVDMFIKAKSIDNSLSEVADKRIATYIKYYPNKEEAFFRNVSEGDTYKVGCWINETTTARF